MPTSPNLGITHVEEHQDEIDVTINGATDALDLAVTGLLAKTITSADVTLALNEAATAAYMRVTGAFTANRTMNVPLAKKLFVVEHGGTGGFTLTVKTASGTGVAIAQGVTQLVYCDATNVAAVSPATGAGGSPYDVAGFYPGQPGASALAFSWVIGRAIQFPINFAGSFAKLGVATTDAKTFSVRKNGSELGTFAFAAAGTSATFTLASATNFAAGDLLTVIAPTLQDSTLQDLSLTLLAARI